MARAAPTITQAMSRADIFGPFFAGPSFDNWRVVLKAIFAEPMSPDDLAVYQRFTGRTAAPNKQFTEAALVMGRRSGKTRFMALIATYLACFRQYDRYLAPGEVATVAVISQNRQQARTAMRFISGLINAVPGLQSAILAEDGEKIVLANRVVIEVHTASFRATRGYTFAAVVTDETAYWRDETAANPDVEIFRALRPALSTIPGALLLNASSPYRRAGQLWATYKRHYGKDDGRVLVWQAPTEAMNSTVPAADIAQAYDDDPESAASEYGAQFRSDIADFINRDIVEACIEDGCYERPPARAAGRSYVAFIDAAGGSGSDSMTLAIAHREPHPVMLGEHVVVLDAIRERRPPFSPDDVVIEFSALMKDYGVHRAESDKWGGDWVISAFEKHRVRIAPTAKPKGDLYRELLPQINGRRCALLDHTRLVAQLCGLERRTGSSGRDSIDRAPGGHDDVANAVAGACGMVAGGRQPMNISREAAYG